MRFSCLLLATLLASLSTSAQTLQFTGATVFANNTVEVVITGPTNTTYHLQRLNRTNQMFEVVSTFSLTTNSSTSITVALSQGNYGFLRVRSTNSTILSSNAVGVVVGSVGLGHTLLGNPFDAQTVANIFTNPTDGMAVYRWVPAITNYVVADYIGGVGWTTNLAIGKLEGFFVNNPLTNTVRYVLGGIFGTNDSRALQKGDNLIASQRLYLITPSTGQSDVLSTNDLDGFSNLPVLATGFSSQSRLSKYKPSTGTYDEYSLTNSAGWYLLGTKTTVPIFLAEGFWVNRPTDATWTVTRPIW